MGNFRLKSSAERKNSLYLDCAYSLLTQPEAEWQEERIVFQLTTVNGWWVCTAYASKSEAEAAFPDMQSLVFRPRF